MSKNQKIAYILGAVIILIFIWFNTPAESLPEEAWGTGLKVRLIGFIAIALLAFYFFFDKVVGKKGKGK